MILRFHPFKPIFRAVLLALQQDLTHSNNLNLIDREFIAFHDERHFPENFLKYPVAGQRQQSEFYTTFCTTKKLSSR